MFNTAHLFFFYFQTRMYRDGQAGQEVGYAQRP